MDPPAIPAGMLGPNGSLLDGADVIVQDFKFMAPDPVANAPGGAGFKALVAALKGATVREALGAAAALNLGQAAEGLKALHKLCLTGTKAAGETGVLIKTALAKLNAWIAARDANKEVMATLDANFVAKARKLSKLAPLSAAEAGDGAGLQPADLTSWEALVPAVAALITAGEGANIYGVAVPAAAGRSTAAFAETAELVMAAWTSPKIVLVSSLEGITPSCA